MPTLLTGDMLPPSEKWDKIIALLTGLTGVGKSRLGLTFPAPIWMFNLDRSIGHFQAAWATREVNYEAVTIDVDSTSPAAAQGILRSYNALVDAALKSNEPGTFITDGWDILWDLVKIALVPNLGSELPKEFAPANTWMNRNIRRLGLSKLNNVYTTMASKVWSGAKTETDKMKSDGYKHGQRWMTHEVYLYAPDGKETPLVVPTAGQTGQSHSAYISRSKINEALIGRVVPGLDFAMLYKLTFGKVYPEPERLWKPDAMNVKVADVIADAPAQG